MNQPLSASSTIGKPEDACAFCHASDWQFEAEFFKKPDGETDFEIRDYYRSLWSCGACGHVINHHSVDLSSLYDSAYWDKTYGGNRMLAVYERIMSLPDSQSDNRSRVAFLNATVALMRPGVIDRADRSVLDVGSGLAVFPAVMKQHGWDCTAVDPDQRGAEHARTIAGVNSILGDFMTLDLDRKFDLITFNKVLEHVPQPIDMLRRSCAFLKPEGLVYIELPDAESALADTAFRQEFFIEHYCAFSAMSVASLIRQAGFRMERFERVVEPSGKYTLRALAVPLAAL